MDWQPIETAPKDTYLLVCGDSGYIGISIRVHVAKLNTSYKSEKEEGQWRTHSNDHFEDDGSPPTPLEIFNNSLKEIDWI